MDNVDLKHGFILLDKTKNCEKREIPINETLRTHLQNITRRLDISGADRDRTDDLLNAMYFQADLAFSPLLSND